MLKEIYEVEFSESNPNTRAIFSHVSQNGSDYWELGRSDKIKTKRLYGVAIVSKEKGDKILNNCKANAGRCHTKEDLTKFVDSVLTFAKLEHLEEVSEGNYLFCVDFKAEVNLKGPILEHRTE